MVKHREVETVFKKFDEDGSGSLDTHEVDKMLSKHGIEIPRNDLKELFTFIAGHPTNELNLEQFKEFTFSGSANRIFRSLVAQARSK